MLFEVVEGKKVDNPILYCYMNVIVNKRLSSCKASQYSPSKPSSDKQSNFLISSFILVMIDKSLKLL
ncbi:unnamed protein product [Trifolium pratense]|uniref:Uncharacterized protein n=1 Tax=Trifolium pratense TaxID=57577 RepID=A0ACB0JND9_TRIPR|nr:unnamed protein product [Trifolium pratense]